MTDDHTGDAPGSDERPKKRPPPTIDLEASEVSDAASSGNAGGPSWSSRLQLARILPGLVGALAALIVMGILWAAGWTGPEAQPTAAVPPSVASGLNELSDRVGKVETKLSSVPATPDGALRSQVDALEHSIMSLREQSTALRKQVDAASAALNDLKAAPRDGGAPADLSTLTERLSRLEQAMRAMPEKSTPVSAADDARPRRLVIATVLETKVRRGEPYAAALAAAKAVAEDKAALAPLDAYAETGVPTDAALAKDLQALLPQLAPAASAATQGEPATKGGLLDRLASNASRLVRVERADAPSPASPDPGVQLQSINTGVLQADVARARAEIEKLPPDLKAKAQPWLDRVNARDAAIKTAAAFSASTLAALSKAE